MHTYRWLCDSSASFILVPSTASYLMVSYVQHSCYPGLSKKHMDKTKLLLMEATSMNE